MIREIEKIFSSHKNELRAKQMSQYMRNQFIFFGIDAKKRREISKNWIHNTKSYSQETLQNLVIELWAKPEREYQYLAMDVIAKNKKRFGSDQIQFIEQLILSKPWWDTVDWLGSHMVGKAFLENDVTRMNYTKHWLSSSNIWLNRCCLIYQLFYKDKTNFENLEFTIYALMHKDEFFIQKAIGWSLRQYSKTNAPAVTDFIENNPDLSALAKREGLKYVNSKV